MDGPAVYPTNAPATAPTGPNTTAPDRAPKAASTAAFLGQCSNRNKRQRYQCRNN